MSEPIPALPSTCGWVVDWGCVPDEDDINPIVKARAESLAIESLRRLTGYRVGGCPITVRPCARRCIPANAVWTDGVWMQPFIGWNGMWVNGCGCDGDCSCGPLSEVILPGPVGRVDEVRVDGLALDPTSYRVDNGNRLVRLDGDWPVCSDMTAAPDEEGAFTVTYLRAAEPDGLASYAAGVLAYEFAKACRGDACELPPAVTALTRQGVSMEFAVGAFPGNRTGITAIDSWLSIWNPYSVTAQAAVFSPDSRTPRQTTWSPL